MMNHNFFSPSFACLFGSSPLSKKRETVLLTKGNNVALTLLHFFLFVFVVSATLLVFAQSVFAAPETKIKPVSMPLLSRMKAQNVDRYAPIYMRAFKKERVIEVWKKANAGNYILVKSFPICRWSGKLGPKIKEGDGQTPEGFYTVSPRQLNPNSSYHLSFNIGFPNAYDRANGRTGNYLMVHGNCVSIGCFAMTNAGIEEIYALVREAFVGGQRSFPFHSFPFRMTKRNIAKHSRDENAAFWLSLKPAYDLFEATHYPPQINVCNRSYVVNFPGSPAGCRKEQNNITIATSAPLPQPNPAKNATLQVAQN